MAQYESERSLLTLGAAATTAGTTAVNGAAIDMAGFDGVLIFGTIATAASGNFLKAQGGEASDLSDAADLAGTKVVTDSDADLAILDIQKPRERYIRGVFVRGTSTAVGDLYYIRYNDSEQPETRNDVANTQNLVRLISPAEGTP